MATAAAAAQRARRGCVSERPGTREGRPQTCWRGDSLALAGPVHQGQTHQDPGLRDGLPYLETNTTVTKMSRDTDAQP